MGVGAVCLSQAFCIFDASSLKTGVAGAELQIKALGGADLSQNEPATKLCRAHFVQHGNLPSQVVVTMRHGQSFAIAG